MLSREETVRRARSYAEEGFLCSESVLMALADCLVVSSELVPRVRARDKNTASRTHIGEYFSLDTRQGCLVSFNL